jgi:hypothetical protein
VNGEPTVRHYTSHRSVLKPAPAAAVGGSLDAIVMPAARPADHLLHGMELAVRLGCEFVALCSGQTRLSEAAGLAREVPGLSCALVDLQDGWTSELLEFRTSRFEAATRRRHSDLSTKRNIGLLLARMAGWQRILFLDDDIRLDADLVRGAAATLRPGRATGMRAFDFPDNSVVSHALREVGVDQDVFVSGSALLVDTTRIDSFFPDVYNEDWLFLFEAVRFGQVSPFGEVSQEKYDPFADPGRAVREEFGEVLAEGLMSLLHYAGGTQRALTEKYWDTVLDQRRAMLRSIAELLEKSEKSDAAAAVRAAGEETDGFTGALLARYVRQWQRDARLWRGRIEALPPAPSVQAALDRLRLPYLSVRPGQLEQQPLLDAGRVVGERLAQARPLESDLAVQLVGRVVAVEDPQPHPRHLPFAKVRQHPRHHRGPETATAGGRGDPEVAEIPVGDGDVGAPSRTEKRLRLRRIVAGPDEPVAAAQLGFPTLLSVLSFLGERGQKRRRRFAQGVESR